MIKYREKLKERFAVYSIEGTNFNNPKIFKKTKDIGDYCRINTSHILSVCKGNRQHTQGYIIVNWDAVKKKTKK